MNNRLCCIDQKKSQTKTGVIRQLLNTPPDFCEIRAWGLINHWQTGFSTFYWMSQLITTLFHVLKFYLLTKICHEHLPWKPSDISKCIIITLNLVLHNIKHVHINGVKIRKFCTKRHSWSNKILSCNVLLLTVYYLFIYYSVKQQ